MRIKLRHRIASAFMAGALCLAMLPTTALAEEGGTIEHDTSATGATEVGKTEAENPATPETAAGDTRFSISAGAEGLDGFDHINEELYALGDTEGTMNYGEASPLLIQVDAPAKGATLAVALNGDAVFSDTGNTEFTRIFDNGEEAAAWVLYVQADGDFTATATYTDGENSQSKTATVTMRDVPMLMALPRSSEQYHITGVDKVGGEWLITFEGEYQSYCMDKGLDGKPSSSVYWTFYGTTDLLEKAAQAGCTTKNEIQQYVWDHRDEAGDSGSSYVYAASESGWQNVVTTFGHGGGDDPEPTPPPEETPSPTPEPTPEPRYGAEWSADVTENASASFNASLTVRVNKYANVTHESISDAEITISAASAGETLDGGSWDVSPANQVIRTVNGDGSVSFSYTGSVTRSASRSDSGSASDYPSQSAADDAANAARTAAESRLRAEAQNDAQAQANAAIAGASAAARNLLLTETTVPTGFSGTADSNQSLSIQPNGSATAQIANTPWHATLKWEKRDAINGNPLGANTGFELQEWSAANNAFAVSPNYSVKRLTDGSYTVTVCNADYTDWHEGCLYYTQDNQGRFRLVETTPAPGYTLNTVDSEQWVQEFAITADNQVFDFTGDHADRNHSLRATVKWEKQDAISYNRLAADTGFTFYEWSQTANGYIVSPNYAVTRENGLYSVTVINTAWQNWDAGYIYYTEDNLGKYRIVETSPAMGHTGVTESGAEPWSADIAITENGQSFDFTGDNSDPNLPWSASLQWEKLDALAGGRLTEDTAFTLYEWSVANGKYEATPNYRIVRLADGTYSVKVTNERWHNVADGRIYYSESNAGKFKVVEKTAAYGYTTEQANNKAPWSEEIQITADGQKFEYLGSKADCNRPWGNEVIIKKVDIETGNAIAGDAVFSLYEWNQSRGLYEISTNYAVARAADGNYTVKCLHDDWTLAEYGSLYFEDTLCDVRENTTNSDGTTSTHTKYYTDNDMAGYANSRANTNDGQFLVVEHQAPTGYYGDWTDIDNPGTASTDLGKRAYYLRLTGDGSTIVVGNADYNADITSTDNGSTRVETANGIVTVNISGNPKNADRTYTTDSTGLANNEDMRVVKANGEVLKNDRVLGEIVLTKVDLDSMLTLAAGSNGETTLEGAVYDLYAADDIKHPDGVTGIVDYSKITENGAPIWHTTVKTNGGWDTNYLPILQKDHLVASAAIKDGKLVFANLYLGRYYLVERATGLVLLQDGAGKFYVNGQYPTLNKKLEATGSYKALAAAGGEYTDYLYKNQYSTVAEGRALDGTKTYDGYYLSYATGYLCDEVNHYKALTYGGESTYVNRTEQQSQDEVLKGGFALNKLVSTTGQPSPAFKLEGAGFTIYRVADLSKAAQFKKGADGSYDVQSIYEAYRKDSYDQNTKKYGFSGESAAVVTMYESNSDSVNGFNASLTANGDNANGSGKGWQPTSEANQYKLGEIYSNEDGILRVEGLPYGQYLVVETTIPKDVFQADPFLISINATTPQSKFSQPAGNVTPPSNSYLTYNILNEELEGYLQLIKLDAETGKAVKIANTSFSIYYITGGQEKIVEMNDPASGNATKKTSVFYTDENGEMKTPEKLPLGKYRIVELEGPEGFFNNDQFNVEFELTSERVWQVIGNSADDMDDYIITENYANHETLGQLTIRKTGEVLTGYENGQFTYETAALDGAEYGIYAKGDIATADRQGTLWYADGDLVATITTGKDGQIDTARFAPTRTQATYDFLSVIHDGTKGEVSITLPLGSYEIHETKAPYGYVITDTSYSVTFTWNGQDEKIVLADDVFVFENDRVVPVPDKPGKVGVGIYKQDAENDKYLSGASYALYSTDDIFDIKGNKLVDAGALLATTGPTDDTGFAWFAVDVPIRNPELGNSGDYTIVETVAPAGYLLDSTPLPVSFTYPGQYIAYQVVNATNKNIQTTVHISKRDLTNGNELPGAILAITDGEGNEITKWGSTDKPYTIRGLEVGKEYTLTELRAAQGYALAENIVFKLEQSTDEDGALLQENEVYFKDAAGDWKLLDDKNIIMQDDITRVQISKTDIVTGEELPGATLIITNTHGEESTRWVTDGTPHYIEKIPAGDYILTELTAPDGFTVAESVPFTVQPTGDIQHVIMKDASKLTIRKTDLGGHELPGATITIRDAHGNVIDTWQSAPTPHEMKVTGESDTLPGALLISADAEHIYNMVENAAPAGYEVATTIQFMLRRGNDGKVLVYTRTQPTEPWQPTNSAVLTMVDKPTPPPDEPEPTPEEVPAETPAPTHPVPQTGDSSNPFVWGVVLVLAACGAAYAYWRRKNETK